MFIIAFGSGKQYATRKLMAIKDRNVLEDVKIHAALRSAQSHDEYTHGPFEIVTIN